MKILFKNNNAQLRGRFEPDIVLYTGLILHSLHQAARRQENQVLFFTRNIFIEGEILEATENRMKMEKGQ